MRRPPVVIVLCLLVALAGCSGGGGLDVRPGPPERREAAPSFTLPNLRGGPDISLASYAGRPVLLNFWASYCGPCREEMPALQAFAKANRDIAVVGVAALDRPGDSRAFIRDMGIGFDLGVDREGAALGRYGATSLPLTVLIDARGRVVSTLYGPVSASDLTSIGATLRAA